MSKYLVKILSICAFVILLPLIVVGSALCVTEAIGVKVTVAANGVEGGEGTSSQVAIYIGGEKQENSTIVIKKNTEVTVTYEGIGYDFQGWYNGNYAEIGENAKAASKEESYKFIVRGNTVLTAVRNVKRYTITYGGKMDDGTTDVAVDPATQEYLYGQQLADLNPVVAGRTLSGWYVAGSETEEGAAATKVANFAKSGAYTVNPLWSDQMFVKYYKNDTLIASEVVASDEVATYQLLAGTDERVVEAIGEGYSFNGWTDGTNDVTSLPEYRVAGYTLYLKEKVNNYNVAVKYNAISNDITEINYDVVNGFAAYNVTRAGYTLQGFKYNNVVYAYDENTKDYVNDGAKLSAEVLAHDGLDVVAVWECNYAAFNLGLGGNIGVFADQEHTQPAYVDDNETSINFVDQEGFNDLTDKIFKFYKDAVNATKFYNISGDEVVWNGWFKIAVNGVFITGARYQSTENTLTFARLMSYASGVYQGDLAGQRITVQFEFVEA